MPRERVHARYLVPLAVALAGGVMASACGNAQPTTAASAAGHDEGARMRQQRCAEIVWSADHETGDLSQWYADDGGGEFNSGAGTSSASQDVARGGRYSVQATIPTHEGASDSGVRLFRWSESRAHPEACYSAWYYFPQRFVVGEWWNILSFKSRRGTANDVFWELQIGNRPDGAMLVYLTWWGPSLEGPHPGETGLRHYAQWVKDVPVGRWTHLEVYLRQSGAFDGQIIVWQDDVTLFNLNNVRTRYPTAKGENEWSINNYSDKIRPSPTTFYVDDATISIPAAGHSVR